MRYPRCRREISLDGEQIIGATCSKVIADSKTAGELSSLIALALKQEWPEDNGNLIDYEAAERMAVQVLQICEENLGSRLLRLNYEEEWNYFIAEHLGAIWEFDRKGWVVLLRRIAAGRGFGLDQFGLHVASNHCSLGNMSASDAIEELQNLGEWDE